MARDLRDPTWLGIFLLRQRELGGPSRRLSDLADMFRESLAATSNYRDETTLQKYGDPRELPSTLPN